MEHKFLKLFVNGVWTRPDRTIKVNGVEHDMDEYAQEHGIELPEGEKWINTDIEEPHEDMEGSHDSADTEVDGDGDSESTE